MNREEITRMARGAGFAVGLGSPVHHKLNAFAALVAAAERNKLAAWMIQFGFATGHGDTMEQLVDALGSEIVDRIEVEIDCEREACAKVAEAHAIDREDEYVCDKIAAAIRARSNT